MRALLRYIIEDKRVYARVLEEIDEAFESRGSSTAFSYAEGCTLEYFQVCLKEALRLHPAVQMILPRVVPTEGAVLCGHFLPAGESSTFKGQSQTDSFCLQGSRSESVHL